MTYSNEEALEMQRQYLERQAIEEYHTRWDHKTALRKIHDEGIDEYNAGVENSLRTLQQARKEYVADNLTQTGNKLMLLGCQATLLTWFGLPMLFILIAFIASLF